MANFAEVRKQIKDKLIEVLNNEKSSGKLTDVKYIAYGDRAKVGELKTPTVWILPASHTPQVATMKMMEHNFTFDFAALVSSNDPEKGLELAEDIAARVFDIISSDRRLGGLVDDVTPTRIDPSQKGEANTQLYWATMQFAFKVRI